MIQRIRDEVLDILKIKPSSVETMAHLIGTNKGEIYWAIHNLRRDGHRIVNINGKYKIATNMDEIRSEANRLEKIGGGHFVTAKSMKKQKTKYEQLGLFGRGGKNEN